MTLSSEYDPGHVFGDSEPRRADDLCPAVCPHDPPVESGDLVRIDCTNHRVSHVRSNLWSEVRSQQPLELITSIAKLLEHLYLPGFDSERRQRVCAWNPLA